VTLEAAGYGTQRHPKTGFDRLTGPAGGIKKNPNSWFGLNPPKEEVEETAEVVKLDNR